MGNELLKTNVRSKKISEDVLLYGTCISEEHPEMLKKFKQKTRLHVCLEEEHVNKVAWKMANIVRANKIKKITAATIDGSPHCVQLHYALEDLRELFPALVVEHYVIEKGKRINIQPDAVRKSRHLSEI
ncbi:MAG: hypothetical protein HY930_02755 [Euryarchaeota archaeon]|nr:hypothetical protein [Euryarchaeota archaeon]